MTDQPTNQQLDDIAARASRATPGPWEEHDDYGPHFYAYLRGPYLRGVGTLNFGDGEDAAADREFVKHAREDVDALLAEVRRLKGQRKYLITQLAKRDAETGDADRKVLEFLGGAPGPIVQPTGYLVSCLPEGHDERWTFTVQVQHAGRGLFSVSHKMRRYGVDGEWSYEPSFDEDDDAAELEWAAAHRFDHDTALCLARELAPTLTYRGRSVADVLAEDAAAAASGGGR